MKVFSFLFACLWMVGCALPITSSNSNTPAKTCKYVERDLTATWEQRSYWCLPRQSRDIRDESSEEDTP